MMANEFDIEKEITEALREYSNEVILGVNACAETCSKELQKELKNTSPKKTGSYKRGWRVKQIAKNATQSAFIVYNATDYQLTHLLEFGHAIHGGTKRVKAYPHIQQAADRAVNSFVEKVEKVVEEAGK